MNSSNLSGDQVGVLVAVTMRYLDFVRRLNARMGEAHFPSEDCLNDATRRVLPHLEAYAKFLAELKEWVDYMQGIERERGYQILPNTTRRERYRHVPPKKSGDVF